LLCSRFLRVLPPQDVERLRSLIHALPARLLSLADRILAIVFEYRDEGIGTASGKSGALPEISHARQQSRSCVELRSIEPLGLFTVAIRLVAWFAGPGCLMGLFFVSTLLGASAAVTLTSLGSANVQPGYLLLGFVTLYALGKERLRNAAVVSLGFPR